MNLEFIRKKLPVFILILGVFYSLSYVKCFKRGIFFTSDGGIKYFKTLQMARGDFGLDFKIKGDKLEEKIWKEGFYPTASPFVVKFKGKYYSVSPWLFSFLTLPFFKLFGFYGIHVVPLISLWGIWFLIYLFLKRENLNTYERSIFLFSIIFSSPITFYGATFWEHTLSLFFLLLSVFMIYYRKNPYLAPIFLLFSQILRPEVMLISFFIILYVYFSDFKKRYKVKFIFTFLCLLFLQFGFNFYYFGSPFGLRFLQVKELLRNRNFTFLTSIKFRIVLGILVYKFFLNSLLKYFTLYFLGIFFLFNLKRNFKYLIFIIFIPFLTGFGVPNGGGVQWGPRYLLPLILIFFLIMVIVYKGMGFKLKRGFLVIFVVMSFFLFKWNTLSARKTYCIQVSYKYNNNFVKFLENREEKVIVTMYLQSALELAYFHGKKEFFYVDKPFKLYRLAELLYKNNVREFILINETFVGREYKIPLKFKFKKICVFIYPLRKSLYADFYKVKLVPESTLSNKLPQY